MPALPFSVQLFFTAIVPALWNISMLYLKPVRSEGPPWPRGDGDSRWNQLPKLESLQATGGNEDLNNKLKLFHREAATLLKICEKAMTAYHRRGTEMRMK